MNSSDLFTTDVVSGNARIHVYHTKFKDLPTIFCIHGGPGLDHSYFLPAILNLESHFNLVFYDLRGDGESQLYVQNDYEIKAHVSDLFAVALSLKISGKLGVLGHSFGGIIATEALAEDQNFFSFGILCSTFSRFSDWYSYISETSKLLINPSTDEIEKTYANSQKENVDFQKLCLAYAPLYFPELSLEAARAIMNQWNYEARTYNRASESIFSKIDTSQQCRKITAKCLSIFGDQDKVVSPSENKRFLNLIKNIDTAFVKDAGHFPFLTKTTDFKNLILEWWRKIEHQI